MTNLRLKNVVASGGLAPLLGSTSSRGGRREGAAVVEGLPSPNMVAQKMDDPDMA